MRAASCTRISRLRPKASTWPWCEPDGETVVSAFSPEFPPQYEDVSYGIASSSAETKLIELGDGGAGADSRQRKPGHDVGQPGVRAEPAVAERTAGNRIQRRRRCRRPSTTVLQVDFNDRNNTGNTQPGFSSFVINGTTNIQTAPVTRSFGGINVTLTDVSGVGYDDRSRTTPTNSRHVFRRPVAAGFRVFDRPTRAPAGWTLRSRALCPVPRTRSRCGRSTTGSTGLRTSDWTANGVTHRGLWLRRGRHADIERHVQVWVCGHRQQPRPDRAARPQG